MKTFKKINYKGKHFIIQDEELKNEDLFIDETIGTITKKDAMDEYFVKRHKKCCDYYGIPPVITKDKDLNKIYN